jgi:hypothetical protein
VGKTVDFFLKAWSFLLLPNGNQFWYEAQPIIYVRYRRKMYGICLALTVILRCVVAQEGFHR